MTLLAYDGFELYLGLSPGVINSWTLSGGTAQAIQTRTGRGGIGYSCYRSPGGNWTMRKGGSGGPTYTTLILGAAYENIGGVGTNVDLLHMLDNTTVQMSIRYVAIATGYGVAVYRGSTLLATSAIIPSILSGSFNYLEFKCTFHGTTGAYEVKVDEITVLSATGVDTTQTANNYANGYGCGGNSGSLAFDDFYACDGTGSAPYNNFLGDVRVETLMPSANSSVQWTPSTGSNWQCIDEFAVSTADYVQSSTAGHKDTYDLANLSSNPAQIFAVTPVIYHAKTDSGARTIRPILNSGGTQGNGTTVSPVLNTPIYSMTTFLVDPNGGGAWNQTSVNALKAGFEVVT